MGVASAFNRVLREHVHIHAAWVPVTSPITLGDYGVWRDGVFAPIGNIREYGVPIERVSGRGVQLDFTSSGVRETRVVGGASVPAFPAVDVGGELQLEFANAESFMLKAGTLRSTRITNIAAITRALVKAWRGGGAQRWRLRYKIVSEVFEGSDVLLLATTQKRTRVQLRGSARALSRLRGGQADASLDVCSNKHLGLKIVGGSGVIGLGLFRVRACGTPSLSFVDDGEEADDAAIVDEDGQLYELAAEDEWDAAIVDDAEELEELT